MRLEFLADKGGFYTPDDPMIFCLLCAIGGINADGLEHHMTLQRGTEDEDPDEDWGIHFCFDDQINGAYNCIHRCRLTRSLIEVVLLNPIDPKEKITTVAANIANLDDPTFMAIRNGLPRIFRAHEEILEIA